MMNEAGLDPASSQAPVDGIRGFVQRHLREIAADEDRDYSDLNDDPLTDDDNDMVFPNITFNSHADDVMVFRHRPHRTDPSCVFFDTWTLQYLVDEDELPEERPHDRHDKPGEKHSALVIDQDGGNLPRVQQGMNSTACDGLWLGDLEVHRRHFHRTLADDIERGQAKETA